MGVPLAPLRSITTSPPAECSWLMDVWMYGCVDGGIYMWTCVIRGHPILEA